MSYADLFYYDTSSPSGLRWKVDRRSGRGFGVLVARANDPAGSLNKEGYYTTWYLRKAVKCRNVVAELNGLVVEEGFIIDHENGNTADNRITNLRLVTKSGNSRNSKKYSNNTTGVTGVCEHSYTDTGRKYNFYLAHWKDLEGKPKRKYFNIDRLGKESAFEQACSHRKSMIESLNLTGAGYTERHGE